MAGGAGDDSIYGGFGTDRVNCGAGADLIFGGGDADTFVYTATNHSTTATRDRINDFTLMSDIFDLSGIDANTLVAGNQAFSWHCQTKST